MSSEKHNAQVSNPWVSNNTSVSQCTLITGTTNLFYHPYNMNDVDIKLLKKCIRSLSTHKSSSYYKLMHLPYPNADTSYVYQQPSTLVQLQYKT